MIDRWSLWGITLDSAGLSRAPWSNGEWLVVEGNDGSSGDWAQSTALGGWKCVPKVGNDDPKSAMV